VSNKVFTNLINSDSKNKARINLKNLILYKPHPDYLDKYKPLEFERISKLYFKIRFRKKLSSRKQEKNY